MKSSCLSWMEKDQIAFLRGRLGWSIPKIAKLLGRGRGVVEYHCIMQAIDPPHARATLTYRGPMSIQRGTHTVRRFTTDEDQQLMALEAQAKSYHAIGVILGRGASSIKARLAILARREEREMSCA